MTVVLLAVVCAVAIAVLKNQSPEIALIAEIGAVVIIGIAAASAVKDALGSVSGLLSGVDFDSQTLSTVLKCFLLLGAGELCADICKDSSQGALATTVLLFSRLGALICALPLFTAVLEIALTFLQK